MGGNYGKKRFFKSFIDGARKKKADDKRKGDSAGRQIIKKETQLYQSNIGNQKSYEEEQHKDLDLSFTEKTETVWNKKRSELARAVCVAITVIAVLASIGVTGYALYIAKKVPAENTFPTIDPYGNIPEGEKKVIFIKEHDSESGALTPSEIYEKCKGAVVTVLCEDNSSVGSGFIYSADGYIATAAHVVENCEQISVVTYNNRKFIAKLIQSDTKTDVALLKIDAKNLPCVELGISSELLVGEDVYAIGTPASVDYAGSFCSGEVTYFNRVLSIYDNTGALEKKMTVIQTNAVLNSGNSGSPLFDGFGRVVGMVTMKLGGEYDGIGFALPADGVSNILDAMMKNEIPDDDVVSSFVTLAPKLGIFGETVSKDGKYGYQISSFAECGSTAKTVLREGDTVVGIDGEEVSRYEEIVNIINRKKPKDTVSVTVIRNRQSLTFDIILGQ
ncbi:MAG: PDZ domain-containing protein [Ruminococcaceae bacterium]|nr:PDZ domain-containing protein [Oscillospiraceae bacterium]